MVPSGHAPLRCPAQATGELDTPGPICHLGMLSMPLRLAANEANLSQARADPGGRARAVRCGIGLLRLSDGSRVRDAEPSPYRADLSRPCGRVLRGGSPALHEH